MPDFQLFRVKIYKPSQINIIEKDKSRPEILKDVIFSLPSVELRKGKTWNVGNVVPLDETGLYFRIGRISKSTKGSYQGGNFIDQEFEMAPYTHVVLDVIFGVCAIAKKAQLSSKVSGIANQFIRLLNRSDQARFFEAWFDIDEINDPEDFLAHLHHAIAISKFWLTFSRPNPFDANKDIIKPLGETLDKLDGEKGRLELQGQSLRADSLEEIARSAASTGNNAGALLLEEGRRKVKKVLRDNPATISEEDLSDLQQRKKFLQGIREFYHRIRGNNGAG